ncbi:MAG: osmotically-inducible protein OsmY [Saprospiraceae bacterium]|jgi:osmotically-inducible protein OsmY
MSNQPSQLRNLIRNSILASSIALLSACIPAAIGVISVTAIDLIKERRTMGTIIDDNLAEASIKGSILKDKSMRPGVHISVTALNGVVLLSGEVTSETQKAHAEDIANSYQGVAQVVNQLEIAGTSSLTSRANDTLITAKVKTELVRSKDVDSTNIKVVTERGVVHLLGIVTPIEGETAVALAKNVSGVTRIIKVFMPPV